MGSTASGDGRDGLTLQDVAVPLVLSIWQNHEDRDNARDIAATLGLQVESVHAELSAARAAATTLGLARRMQADSHFPGGLLVLLDVLNGLLLGADAAELLKPEEKHLGPELKTMLDRLLAEIRRSDPDTYAVICDGLRCSGSFRTFRARQDAYEKQLWHPTKKGDRPLQAIGRLLGQAVTGQENLAVAIVGAALAKSQVEIVRAWLAHSMRPL